jgi:O-antigen/teichoic acid export membrane protein
MAAKYFRFNSEVFNLTKKMALASILVTFSWILYYELDPLYVSLLYDSNIVAVFAIGLTMLTFSRSIMNAFFSPFQIKFNHLRGINDEKNLSKLFLKLIEW